MSSSAIPPDFRHVEVHGDAGPVVLMLHGALSDARQNWRMVVEPLARHFRLLAPDLRGHGRSNDAPLVLDGLVDDALALLDAHAVDRTHLLGCSLGGYVALALRHRAPHRVKSLALAGVKVGWTPEFAAVRAARFTPEAIAAAYPIWVPHLAKAHAAGPDQWRVLAARVATLLAGLANEPALGLDALATDRLPLFYAVGDRDNLVPLAEVVTIREVRADAEILVVPRAGHLFREYDATVFATAYTAFLRRAERA